VGRLTAERTDAKERLEAEVGPELAQLLVESLVPKRAV
jgi:hypothetical protein